MPALGEEFRSAREARGLTLSEVAEQIHIRSVYLGAIENEEWSQIVAAVYVRGFIRTYARFLGLNPETAIDRFNAASPPPERQPPSTGSAIRTDAPADRGVSPWAWIGGLVAMLLVAVVGYEWWQYRQSAPAQPVAGVTAAPAATALEPVPTPHPAPGKPKPAPVLHRRLAVVLRERSWVRVTVDGRTVMEGIYPAGTTKAFTGDAADVRAGNAGGVTVSVDGAPARSLGNPGDVVEQRYRL